MRFINRKIRLKDLERQIDIYVKAGDLDRAEHLSGEMVRLAESDSTHVSVCEQCELCSPALPVMTRNRSLPALRRRTALGMVAGLALALLMAIPMLFFHPVAHKDDSPRIPTYSEHLLASTGRNFTSSSHSEAEHYHMINSYLRQYGPRLFKSRFAQDTFMHAACASSRQQESIHRSIPRPLQEGSNARVGRQLDEYCRHTRG